MNKDSRLQDARDYAASISDRLADRALDDDFGFAEHVTHEDKLRYIERHRRNAAEIRDCKHDHNFTIWQRMNYYLTGKDVALLPS